MSVCMCVCFKLSDHHHDHSGDIMIMGGPAGTRGSPAQGRRGPLRAPGVLRRARSMLAGLPAGGVLPMSASPSLSVCLPHQAHQERMTIRLCSIPTQVHHQSHHHQCRQSDARIGRLRQSATRHDEQRQKFSGSTRPPTHHRGNKSPCTGTT